MRSIGHPVSKIWSKSWTNIGLIRLGVPVAENKSPDLHRPLSGGDGHHTMPDRRSLESASFSQNLPLSSQVWFLSYSAPNRMKLGHNGHLNTSSKFPIEVFPKTNDFPSDFGWTQKPRFWGNEEKSMKSKELEPWIHSKIGGIWWGLS
jgi:hypothetical protein